MTHEQARGWIEKTIRDAGFTCTWRAGAEPVAELGVQLPNRQPLSLTVRHTGHVLQLVAHGALPGDSDPQLLADRDVQSREWAFGRMYFSEKTANWDLSIGLYAPHGSVQPAAFAAAVGSLSDAPAVVLAGLSPELLVTPEPVASEVLPRVEAALVAAGLAPKTLPGGEMFAVGLQLDRAAVEVHWFVWGPLLVARAMPLRAPPILAEPRVLRALNQLNTRLDIGGVGLDYEGQTATAWIAHPIPWFEITPEALRWTSERAGSWVEAAVDAAISAA